MDPIRLTAEQLPVAREEWEQRLEHNGLRPRKISEQMAFDAGWVAALHAVQNHEQLENMEKQR